ncbi:MAG TPA: RNA polymerase sigma factor [Thermomicrobiales bacterium]|nr:RNA polymerase sigma factor [Thermomicrobiales bacterium]
MAMNTKRIPTPEDRNDLLRALAMWTGRFDVAEDLVQQTLFEAWRSDRQPEREEEWRPWLFGVARNVLLRWQRDVGKHGFLTPGGPEDERFLEIASAADDLDSLLTASEMVSLLDDLLGRLPAETRDALVLKYVADLPQTEVAHRLGMHEKALEGRLYRGKKALKRALITDRPDTAISLGLVAEPNVWQEIETLCPACGQRHLAGRWFERGGFHVACRDCAASEERLEILANARKRQRSISRTRPSLSRANRDLLMFWAPFHRDGIHTRAHCTICGHSVTPWLENRPDTANSSSTALHLVFACERCQTSSFHTVAGSGLLIREGQSFWERHRSIHAVPSRVVNWQGVDAIESEWRSGDDHRLTTWYSMSTGALLAVAEDGVRTSALSS